MAHISSVTAKTPCFCDNVYNTTAAGFDKASKYARSAGTNIADGFRSIWASLSSFAAKAAQYIASGFSRLKIALTVALINAKNYIKTMPKEMKIGAAVAAVVVAVGSLLCCCKSEKGESEEKDPKTT